MLQSRLRQLLMSSLVTILMLSLSMHSSPEAQSSATFTFAASGDLGVDEYSNASYRNIPTLGTSFFLALGDLSYNDTTPETRYCEVVKELVGPSFPFEILSGNHEDGGEVHHGLIDNFVQCLPDRLGSTGTYGKEYYFDYPGSNPMARFILISPDLTFTFGGHYSYDVGTSQYNWLSSTIDGARSKGIPWVIVGIHKVCVTIGDKNCELDPDVVKLLLSKKVDLVLQAHDHNYQRSKQLTCMDSPLRDTTQMEYVPSCVADDGSDGTYSKAAGTVFVINGAFGGEGFTPINVTDPRAQYFAKAMGGAPSVGGGGRGTVYGTNDDGVGRGFVAYTLSDDRIDGHFVMTTKITPGPEFSDSFNIVNQGRSPLDWLTGQTNAVAWLALGITAVGLAFWLGRKSKRHSRLAQSSAEQ